MARVEERIAELAGQVARGHGVEVEDVELMGRGRRTLLRVTIDKPGGVSLDDCEAVSKDLSAVLDVEDPLSGPYTLEVTSPGLDRPLKTVAHFRKQVGKLARVVTREPVEGQNFWVGRISAVDDEGVVLETGKGGIRISFDNVSRARLEVEV
ncbi:MAG: ribosome maturation factor RimP [Thermodesulfovibrionales bacterium]